ncbi:ankyrin repeat-containing domain protein [Mycena leptocephala]|nr:ankyrin repeat-containing domain protein [Mycena leptocephala]
MAELVGFASAIAGLVTLAGQITSISYGYLSDVRDAKHTRTQYLTELSALTDALLHAENAAVDAERLAPLAPRPASLSAEVLDDCRNQLTLLKHKLEGHAANSSRSLTRLKSSLTWPLEEQQMKKHIEMLHRFRSIFADYVLASTLTLSEASYSKLDILNQERDRSQLMEWLQPPNPLHHGPPTQPPCPGTGKWFLESDLYVHWRTGAPSFLCGCRKIHVIVSDDFVHHIFTNITSSIILQDLSGNTKASNLLHYFCDFAVGKGQTATSILQSLTRQMLMDGNEAHISVLKRCRERFNTPPGLKELSQAFIELCKLQQACPYIVLDALDELEDRKLLLPLLDDFVTIGCRIFATSRHLPDIADAFAAFEQVELEAERADLKLFIENELRGSDFRDINSPSDIVDKIVDQAGGIFLLAQLLMNHVLGLTTLKQIRQSLAMLPSNLTSAYQSSLDRILAQTTSRKTLALRVIAWITHAERRLKAEELLHAFAVEENEDKIDEENVTSLRILLQVCVGLVIVSDHMTVTLVHATAHTFFKDMHAQLQTLTLIWPVPMDQRIDKMSFLAYAAHYWGRHARGIEQPLTQLICRLLGDSSLCASSFQALQYHQHLDPQLAEASFAALPTGQGPLHVAAFWDLGLDPLHWACFKRSAVVRELLLCNGAPVSIRDTHNWTPLFWASFNGDVEALASLLDRGANHLLRDTYSWTALQWAVSSGARSTVELLLNHHAQFLAQKALQPPILVASLSVAEALQQAHQRRSIVPAEIAAGIGDAKLLDVLLQAIEPDSAFNKGWRRAHFDPPMSNIWRTMNKAEIIHGPGEFLSDVNVNVSCSQYDFQDVCEWRSRLLHAAIRDDKMLMVQLLIELGADPNNTLDGRTPLHTATFRVNHRFVELLLGAGADPTLRDDRGLTALHQAIMNGFEETIAALIKGGADINARTHSPTNKLIRTEDNEGFNASGVTPLMLTCGFQPEVDYLNRYYHKAEQALPTRIAYLLLSAGADTTSFDTSGNTALYYAIAACDLNLVKLLLENGAKIPEPDPTGYCIIHAFAEGRGHGRSAEDLQDLLDLLLKQTPVGAESMEVSSTGPFRSNRRLKMYSARSDNSAVYCQCPLSLAIQSGNWDIVTALLKRGAQLRTTHPLEPFLKAAITQLQPGVVRFLLDLGAKPGQEGGNIKDLLWDTNLLGTDECAREAFALILKDLVKSGVDVNSVSLALLTAVKGTDIPDVVQALLDVGADLYRTDETGLDAFMLSLLHEKDGPWTQPFPSTPPDDNIAYICARLKQHNLVLQRTKTSKSDRSLLQLAVEAGSARVVAQLIACGADREEADEYGWRPLHTAISLGHGAVVDVLLATGADVHAATQKWSRDYRRPKGLRVGDAWTGQPLHLAAMTGDARIAAELLALGADVRASTGTDGHCCLGHGPTALHIALDTGEFYGRKGDVLDRGRLEIATMLVDHGANVNGVASQLDLDDVILFEGREDLWNKLRVGVTEGGAKL